MARFIELHDEARDSEPILINIDAICYVLPDPDDDGCFIYFCCTSLLGNQKSMMETRHVEESYQRVKRMINE